MEKIVLFFEGAEFPLDVDEPELGDLGGLERCFGFIDFKEGMKSGKIHAGSQIQIPKGHTADLDTKTFYFDKYFVVDEKTLKMAFDDGRPLKYSSRKELQGIHWYLRSDK